MLADAAHGMGTVAAVAQGLAGPGPLDRAGYIDLEAADDTFQWTQLDSMGRKVGEAGFQTIGSFFQSRTAPGSHQVCFLVGAALMLPAWRDAVRPAGEADDPQVHAPDGVRVTGNE